MCVFRFARRRFRRGSAALQNRDEFTRTAGGDWRRRHRPPTRVPSRGGVLLQSRTWSKLSFRKSPRLVVVLRRRRNLARADSTDDDDDDDDDDRSSSPSSRACVWRQCALAGAELRAAGTSRVRRRVYGRRVRPRRSKCRPHAAPLRSHVRNEHETHFGTRDAGASSRARRARDVRDVRVSRG